MALVRHTPWNLLGDFENMMERFNRAFGGQLTNGDDLITTADWIPAANICETDESFDIEVGLPGVSKKDVKVAVTDGVLTISGERKQDTQEQGKKYHRVERSYGSFMRRFTLPQNVDSNKIGAKYVDGILRLQLPKTEPSAPPMRQIKVQ